MALTLWLMLGVAVSVRTLLRPHSHTVFPIFAASADHWWADQPLYIDYPGMDLFRYPPLFAVLVTPLSALGLSAGGVLWSWVSIAVCLAGLWHFVRAVVPPPPSPNIGGGGGGRRTAAFLILAGAGALRGLWNAQSNALIVGLLLLGAASLARAASADSRSPRASSRGWWWAAFWLAAAVALKPTPLAPVLLLCALWPRRLAGRVAVLVAVGFLLPFLTRPPMVVLEHYREWIAHLLQSGGGRWLGFRDGWTIWLVLRHLAGGGVGEIPLREPIDSAWYPVVQLLSAVAVLVWCLCQQRRAARLGLGPRWPIHVTLGMGLAWLMLFGPAVEHATYVFLAPPLAWAILERNAWPRGRWLIGASFVLIMGLGWGALTRPLLPALPILLAILPIGTALFTIWLVVYTWAQGPADEQLQRQRAEQRSEEVGGTCTAQRQVTTIPS